VTYNYWNEYCARKSNYTIGINKIIIMHSYWSEVGERSQSISTGHFLFPTPLICLYLSCWVFNNENSMWASSLGLISAVASSMPGRGRDGQGKTGRDRGSSGCEKSVPFSSLPQGHCDRGLATQLSRLWLEEGDREVGILGQGLWCDRVLVLPAGRTMRQTDRQTDSTLPHQTLPN
jgi:hypothetical protein